MNNIHTYLWVSKVDLHDESYSYSCSESETGCDDDCQSIPLTGTLFCKGVSACLPQRSDILASQVRS